MDKVASPENLRRSIAELPDQPGVYLFYDARQKLLYVGKALSLRRRVGSYFRRTVLLSPRVAKMVAAICDVQTRLTHSEAEALLLEAQIIKEQKPRYNVIFRDDKAYPMLKITHEPFPRLVVARRKLDDKARYFGPYPDATLMRQALRFLRRVFPLRTCRAFPDTPCLEYHLGQCLAPCAGYIDEKRYQRLVNDLVAFLEGRRDKLLRDLSRRMQQAARHRRFEEAARLRDQMRALTSVIIAKEKSLSAGPLEQLQAALHLPQLPMRIEAFDISNIFGQAAVGSMVVFVGGKPYKAHYRKFKIETVTGIDDFAMMREVITRRYSGSISSSLPLPDLILIDGGKGQLAAAGEALSALAFKIPAMGLAKRFEHIFVPGKSGPIILLPTSPVLHLIQHIRDEAHRFAITYHRAIRRRSALASLLDEISGIGPARRTRLLKQFGSIRQMAEASAAEVAGKAGISEKMAQSVLDQLHALLKIESSK